MRKMLRKWLGIDTLEKRADTHSYILDGLAGQIDKKIKELDKLTREDWDIGVRGPSTIILTGVYRGRGYVKFYDVPGEQFEDLVQMFRSREKSHLIRNVDAPHLMSGAFKL